MFFWIEMRSKKDSSSILVKPKIHQRLFCKWGHPKRLPHRHENSEKKTAFETMKVVWIDEKHEDPLESKYFPQRLAWNHPKWRLGLYFFLFQVDICSGFQPLNLPGRKKPTKESFQVSHGQKTRGALLSIESWLVKNGILVMVYNNPYITG